MIRKNLTNEQKKNYMVFSPILAKKIGINESIILDKIHKYMNSETNKNIHNGKRYVYNSYKKWTKIFPMISESTIKRSIKNLERLGILETENYNKLKFDKTKHYTINYDKVDKIIQDYESKEEVLKDERTQSEPIEESENKLFDNKRRELNDLFEEIFNQHRTDQEDSKSDSICENEKINLNQNECHFEQTNTNINNKIDTNINNNLNNAQYKFSNENLSSDKSLDVTRSHSINNSDEDISQPNPLLEEFERVFGKNWKRSENLNQPN
jgi:flagellar biosynthesis GTPase FlhF